jgi:nucleoside-diphosphate-sugar epimerase
VTAASLRGQRVLVLGASGFLGGRLVERLVEECGAEVRVLLRRVAAGSATVRFPLDAHVGDLTDAATVRRAIDGCSVIVNCVKGSGPDAALRRAIDVDLSGQLVEAAALTGARVVHVSSMAVYDLPRVGDVTERSPDAPPGDTYSDSKLAGERLALATGARLGVPVTVVQPTVVYGPRATVHASEILEEMRTGRLVLVEGGTGICNAVYVDDVVTALLLAAVTPATAGERFLISGPEHPTWADFFGHFERMLGRPSTISLTEREALELWRRANHRPSLAAAGLRLLREQPEVRARLLETREAELARAAALRLAPRLARSAKARLKGGAAHGTAGTAAAPSGADLTDLTDVEASRPWLVHYLAKRAAVQTTKAQELLGYRPVFGLAEGMRLTEAWARWARLLD